MKSDSSAMVKSCATVVALICLFALSLADHKPPFDDEASSQVAGHKEAVNPEKKFNTLEATSVPLSKFHFRPVSRRFPVRLRRACVSHRKGRREAKGNEQISFGHDMFFYSGENSDFEQPVVYTGGRRISGPWLGLSHRSDEDIDRIKQIVFDREAEIKALKKLRKRLRLQSGEYKEKKMKYGGFMRRVRKFFGHYF